MSLADLRLLSGGAPVPGGRPQRGARWRARQQRRCAAPLLIQYGSTQQWTGQQDSSHTCGHVVVESSREPLLIRRSFHAVGHFAPINLVTSDHYSTESIISPQGQLNILQARHSQDSPIRLKREPICWFAVITPTERVYLIDIHYAGTKPKRPDTVFRASISRK